MVVRWLSTADLDNPLDPGAESAALTASWILYKMTGEKYPGYSTSVDWYGFDRSVDIPYQLINRDALKHLNIYEVHDFTCKYVRVRSRPVLSINSVVYQGTVLSPDDYYIGNKAFIGRTDGTAWDLNSGVLVEYTHGQMPPEAGIRAAKRLADELQLSVSRPDECALPERVTSVSRQGLSFTMLDPQDFLEDGRTGIYEIDLFIKTANPIRARKKPKVFSPDIPSGRRKT